MYQCSNCGATMSYPLDSCPKCGVRLAGVKCKACGYLGTRDEFVRNEDRCPRCNAAQASAWSALEKIPFPEVSLGPRRFAMYMLTFCYSLMVFALRNLLDPSADLSSWRFWYPVIHPFLLGLVVYEMLHRARASLGPGVLVLYVVLAFLMSTALYVFLDGLILGGGELQHYSLQFSLRPFTGSPYPRYHPLNLYAIFESTLLTLIAYGLVRNKRAGFLI
jgi:hypothetical protein